MSDVDHITRTRMSNPDALIPDWDFVNEALRTNRASITDFSFFITSRPLCVPRPPVVKIESSVANDGEEKNDNDDKVMEMYNVEFLWGDDREAKDVKLAGSWNMWEVSQMKKGSNAIWRKVVRLPEGRHEFKFVVDGEWKLSEFHPNSEGEDKKTKNNERIIHKPARLADSLASIPRREPVKLRREYGCCVIM